MLRNEKYYGELLLQKTVTLDYLTKLRVVNNNHVDQYRVDNNHEAIVSKELRDLAQKECERRYAIYSGKIPTGANIQNDMLSASSSYAVFVDQPINEGIGIQNHHQLKLYGNASTILKQTHRQKNDAR